VRAESAVVCLTLKNIALTATTDGLLELWEADKSQPLRSFQTNATVSALAFSPISNLVAVGSANGVVRVYSLPSTTESNPKLVLRARAHKDSVKKVHTLISSPLTQMESILLRAARTGQFSSTTSQPRLLQSGTSHALSRRSAFDGRKLKFGV
jgi:WD40 repeat protein